MKIAKEDVRDYSIYTVFMVVILALALSGCSNMGRFDNWFNTNTDSLKTAVHILTASELKGKPATAALVTATITKLRGHISSGALTSANMVQAYITAEIAKLPILPEDMVIVNDLTGKLQAKIIEAFAVLNLNDPANQLVEIDTVLGWVADVSSVIK